MSRMPFIDLKSQYETLKDPIQQRMAQVLNHGQYIMGPEVTELETQLAHYIGVKHAIAVSSGTDALLIALMALNIGPGDEVIIPPFSFFATVEVILLLGATPVFVDIDPRTFNIDPNLIEAAITSKTKAIMPVSLYGQCVDFDAINALAAQYQLAVIEDGAQSFGATYKDRYSGALSTIGCTSFFPSKTLGCYGDGGACFTNDDLLATHMRQISNHGQQQRYQHLRVGINGRMDTLQAAILLEKLTIFPTEVKTRWQIGNYYSEQLADIVEVPYIEPGNVSVYGQYTIQVDHREQFQAKMQANGIPTAVHYPQLMHQQPAVNLKGDYPVATRAAERVLSLPMHPYLSDEQQQQVILAVKASLV